MTLLLEVMMSEGAQQQQQQQSSSTLLYNAAGQPVAISLPPPTSDYDQYNSKQSKISGIILIISGILSFLLNGIGLGLHEVGTFAGHGFWGGLFVSNVCY